MGNFVIDEKFLEDVGIHIEDEAKRFAKITKLRGELEMRVGQALARDMTDEQLDEFEEIIDRGEVDGEGLAWLEEEFPDYPKVVETQYKVLRAELKAKGL